jgi:hypothetical protein
MQRAVRTFRGHCSDFDHKSSSATRRTMVEVGIRPPSLVVSLVLFQ